MHDLVLNERKRAVLQARDKEILVVAGPGSGKTSLIIGRTAELINRGVDANRIALVTYTNTAAGEMRQRLRELGIERIGYVGTLHSLALQIARSAYGEMLPLDQEEAEDLLLAKSREVGAKVPTSTLLEAAKKKNPGAATLAGIAVHAWRNYMARHGLVTFDDMLDRALGAFTNDDPEIRTRALEACNFVHLLVDEYQDSSALDDQIYDALPIENKMFVGDADQSIFGFRGADSSVILKRAKKPGVKVVTVDINHRSDAIICWAAANLIEHNKPRMTVRTMAMSDAPGMAVAVRHGTEQDETRWLARMIKEDVARGLTCAVLVRTNYLREVFAEALRIAGVQVVERKHEAVPLDWKLAKALIRAAESPGNDHAAAAVVRLKDGIDAAMDATRQAAEKNQPLSALKGFIAATLDEVPALLARNGVGPDSIDLMRRLTANCDNITDLMLAANEVETVVEEEGAGVVVSTIHAAKGREWDVVYLPAWEQHLIPGRCEGDESELNEERRIAYVAMTRARHQLLVSYVEQRMSRFPPKAVLTVEPSQFIEEARLPKTTGMMAGAAKDGSVMFGEIDWRSSTVQQLEERRIRRRESSLKSVRRFREKQRAQNLNNGAENNEGEQQDEIASESGNTSMAVTNQTA